MSNYKIVEIKNLSLTFDKNTASEIKAIDDFSSEYEKGKIHYIIGDSGSGKSTLVLHLNGLLKSKEGNIRIDDILISGKKRKIKNVKNLRRKISLVFQYPEYQLFKDTIHNDIIFGPKALGIPKLIYKAINKKNIQKVVVKNIDKTLSSFFKIFRKSIEKEYFLNHFEINKWKFKRDVVYAQIKIDKYKFWDEFHLEKKTIESIERDISKKYLNKMGMDDIFLDRNPFGLSGGQKRRVAISGILSIDPDILVFDEPTAGLDPSGEEETMNIISDLKKHHKTIFVITHSMDQVLLNGDSVTVMNKGKILLKGDPYEIFTNPILYKYTKMEMPKIIQFINSLSEKNPIFKELIDLKPRTDDQLIEYIIKILDRKS
ncbi:MAG: ATP-binding cassette domain-containing protein [Mycoplasmoidaceae bacterium]